jgi:Secretion system C-terminal sorting domain/Chaperone of endosialidase
MKKRIMIFALISGIGVNGFSQQNVGTLPTNTLPSTTPANISQLETRVRLITQNFYNVPTGTQLTGNFATNSRWNSMGSLNAGSQILNGFRTQTDGRGLTMGFSVPAAGSVTNPFIQWIGSIGVAGGGVTQGNLEFRYAGNPTTPNGDLPIFIMAPTASAAVPSFNYAAKDALVGQLQSGAFGSFLNTDIWSATGQITTTTLIALTTYGTRHQYQGSTFSTGFINNGTSTNAIMDFGRNANSVSTPALNSFKFRTFSDPTQPSSIRNIWQSSITDGNIMLGRQDISVLNPSQYYFSLYDGFPYSLDYPNYVTRAGIYATSTGKYETSGLEIPSYAAIIGDLTVAASTNTTTPSSRYAILGLAANSALSNNWAGYFVGSVGYTGSLVQVSDRKFKTKINDESNIIEKIMQLKPQNYFFDIEKNKNMAFSDKLQHGLISQDVELIFPELVEEASAPVATGTEKGKPTSYKGLNYIGFIPMLIKAIQEQQTQIQDLKTQLNATTKNTFVLNDKNNLPTEIENKAFTLSQNTPNPFSEKTTISYSIPSNVNKAMLAIFDLNGKMLLQYNLKQGKNKLTINGNSLSAGMYLYSLIADGQEVLSKRMVLTK